LKKWKKLKTVRSLPKKQDKKKTAKKNKADKVKLSKKNEQHTE